MREHQPETMPVVCPRWRAPLFQVTPDGIAVRCRSCRGEWHQFSRESLERTWAELEQGTEPETLPPATIERSGES